MAEWLVVIFLAVLGAVIGSFLNVVIYRLPRGESIVSPPSRCPKCGRWIRWYENIPVLSYLALRGRCAGCQTPISPRYALVELITAVLFVAVFDAFYLSNMHNWFDGGLASWPLMAGHLALLAVLVVCSAIDIEFYLIDVRITYFAMIAGVLMWMSVPGAYLSHIDGLPGNPTVILAGLVGAVIGTVIRHRIIFAGMKSQEEQELSEQLGEEKVEELKKDETPKSNGWSVVGLAIFAIGSISLIAWSILGDHDKHAFNMRALAYVTWAFLAIVLGGIPHRESDQEIVEAIEQEKSSARVNALKELLGLLPVIAGFLIGVLAMWWNPAFQEIGWKVYQWKIGVFTPIVGLSYALMGMFLTATFGWAVRILFTLGFGKEAMGVGDIYILAAIGAIAGAFVAIVGFFIGSVIGVFGIVVLLLWKTSRALSYGPWIAIGALVCLLFYNPILNYLKPAGAVLLQLISETEGK
jgi:prepilin signal peptidase PulO-like enzyme (type II secretory pathway)